MVQVAGKAVKDLEYDSDGMALDALSELIGQLKVRMKESAKKLAYEEAADLRDTVNPLRKTYCKNK